MTQTKKTLFNVIDDITLEKTIVYIDFPDIEWTWLYSTYEFIYIHE